ncbi:hypothetical protein HDU93_006273 [Gonapodya sp. JEL0774]|nr:hypothetical protein HDU93_006273 [Gonapodya sp. JEL0774]
MPGLRVPHRSVVLEGQKTVDLSVMGLGLMSLSVFSGGENHTDHQSEETAIEVIGKALEMGINVFNSASFYGSGHNERVLGKAIAKFGRDKFFITDKFGQIRNNSTGQLLGYDCSPESVVKQCEASLSRLGIDTIDVYIPARVDPKVPIEETVSALASLQRAGKIRYIGLSEANADTIRRAAKVAPISFLEIEFSLWTPDIEEVVLPVCRELGIKVLAYSPLGRGLLTGTVKPGESGKLPSTDMRSHFPRFQGDNLTANYQTFVAPLEDIANRMTKESGEVVTPSHVALAWVLSRGPDIIPIPGTKRAKLVEENAKASVLELKKEDLITLNSLSREVKAVGDRYPGGIASMLQDLSVDNRVPLAAGCLDESQEKTGSAQVEDEKSISIRESGAREKSGDAHVVDKKSISILDGKDSRTDNDSTENPIVMEEGKERQGEEQELDDQTNHLPVKQLLLVFLGCGIAIMLSMLDQTIVATALPRISSEFNEADESSWVGTSFLLTSTAFQTLWGRFSDIWGRKVCLLTSLVIFLLGSILCGVAQSLTQLIIYRAVAGVGGGGIVTLVMVVVSDVVSIRERGKYQGLIGAAIAVAGVIGPLLGGVFSDPSGLGWRWCFYLNIPFCTLALALIFFLLPSKQLTGSLRAKVLRVDYLGAALILITTLLLLIPTSWGGTTYPWNSPQIIVLFVFAVMFLILTITGEIWVERRKKLPIIPMRVFLMRTPAVIFLTQFLNGIPFYGQLYYIPQYFQIVKQESGTAAGLQLFPLLVAQTVSVLLSGYIVSRKGRHNKLFIVIGYVLWTVACGLQYTLDRTTSTPVVVTILVFTGLGAGLTFQTSLVAAQASVERQDMAVVTGLRNFFRTTGGTLGLAVCGAILNNALIRKLAAEPLDFPPELVAKIVASATNIPSVVSPDVVFVVLDTYQEALREVYLLFIPCMAISAILSYLFIEEKVLV